MRECLTMFRYSKMIKTAAFCAATFALLSVLLKNVLVIVPEVTEVRLCNALAITYGLYFGPAGALGCAVGNLVGDFGGSLTWLSPFGFAGNFLSAYLPYKLWNWYGQVISEDPLVRPGFKAKHSVVRLLLCIVVSVLPCSLLLGWAMDLQNVLPALDAVIMLSLNNTAASVIGLLLFWLFSVLPEKIVPYWREIM